MRTNIYKQKILSVLHKGHLLSIADIHKAIPEADYSTIFRNIEQLLGTNEIKKVMIDTKSIAYESGDHGHDHFICNDCGLVESIHLPQTKNVLRHKTVTDITVRGLCTECTK
jgi:Fe2+ or Zn2+ uptake regulation protein